MWIMLIIWLPFLIAAKIYQGKASQYLKEEYKQSYNNIFKLSIAFYLSKSYQNPKGAYYKNLALILHLGGFVIAIILTLILS